MPARMLLLSVSYKTINKDVTCFDDDLCNFVGKYQDASGYDIFNGFRDLEWIVDSVSNARALKKKIQKFLSKSVYCLSHEVLIAEYEEQ